MKMKKLIAGIVACALTATSVVITGLTINATDFGSASGEWDQGDFVTNESPEMNGVDLSGVTKVVFYATANDLNYGWNNGQFYAQSDITDWTTKSYGGSEKTDCDVVLEKTGTFSIEIPITITGEAGCYWKLGWATDNAVGAFELNAIKFYKGSEFVCTWIDGTVKTADIPTNNTPFGSTTKDDWQQGDFITNSSPEMSGVDLSGVDKVIFNAVALDLNYGWNNGQFYAQSDVTDYTTKSYGGSEKTDCDVVLEKAGSFSIEMPITITGEAGCYWSLGWATGCEEGAFELKSIDFYKNNELVCTWVTGLVIKEEEPEVTTEETTEPEVTVPEETEPDVTVPDETEPDATVPDETEPDATVPDETEPDATVPDETEPDATVPDETEPDATEPDETEPDVTVPDETEPDVTVPDETEPDVTVPDETEPDVTVPDETEPDVTVPDETEPDVTVPDETEPNVTEPDETEPDVTEPEEPEFIEGSDSGETDVENEKDIVIDIPELKVSLKAGAGTFEEAVSKIIADVQVKLAEASEKDKADVIAAAIKGLAENASDAVSVNSLISVTLKDQDGNSVQPKDGTCVNVNLPYDGKSNYVAYIDGDTAEFIKMNISDGFVSFDAKHFSDYYMISLSDEAVKALEEGDEPAPETSEPDATEAPADTTTGVSGDTNKPSDDKNQPTGVVFAVIPAAVTALGIIISRKRK